MYKLLVSFKARKELKKISIFHKNAILDTLQTLKEDPFLGKPLTRNMSGKFSYRVGVYRIIYRINKKDRWVNILSAGHRSVVYD
ncbi:type II toxin-antitoxin system RelE/ParE family toxin [Candidatus Microgenomates bacterium]|nr:type II toxin-antitoxin system RelE/ParE family toxin [Candidatus Microgenomates bacterium]